MHLICKALHIGQHDTNYEYYLGNSKLENTTMEKDLGVIMDGELKFHNHVADSSSGCKEGKWGVSADQKDHGMSQ